MHLIYTLFVFAVLGLPAIASAATTRYVDSVACTGNYSIDARTCTGANGNSYTSIDACQAAVTAAGDTCLVRAGTYVEAGGVTTWPTVGTVAAPYVLSTYQNEVVTVQSSGAPNSLLMIWGANRNYIQVNGLIIDAANVSANGISIGDGTNTITGIQITRNEIKNAHSQGLMHRHANNSYIAYNKIHDSGCVTCDPSTVGHNIYHSTGTDAIYEYNELYNGWAQGIQMRHAGGIASDNNNSIIRYNYFHDNMQGGGTAQGTTIAHGTNIQYYGNISESNGSGYGVFLDSLCINCKVYNNIFYNNGVGIKILGTVSTATISNNISLNNTVANFDDDNGSNTVISNVIGGTASTYWVDAPNGNFAQIPTAPSINAGTPHTTYCPETTGLTCDQGAHQSLSFASGTCTGNTFVVNFNTKFPPISGMTGFTARVNAAARTVSGVTKTGVSQYTWTISGAAVTAGQNCDFSYTAGTVTDCSDIGRGTGSACTGRNQRLYTTTNQAVTNQTGGSTPTYAIGVYRFELHNGSKGDWLSAENTSVGQPVLAKVRACLGLRVGTAAAPAQDYQWQCSLNGGAYADLLDTSTCGATLVPDDTIENLDSTLNNLSLGGSTFVSGPYSESPFAGSPAVTLASGQQLNQCVAVQLLPTLAPGDTIDLKTIPGDGSAVSGTAPRITVATGSVVRTR